jgi:hypothetical protein
MKLNDIELSAIDLQLTNFSEPLEEAEEVGAGLVEAMGRRWPGRHKAKLMLDRLGRLRTEFTALIEADI